MTHEELLARIDDQDFAYDYLASAVRTVVILCKKWEDKGSFCIPIENVINAIEKELK